jgi:hypothetical protein
MACFDSADTQDSYYHCFKSASTQHSLWIKDLHRWHSVGLFLLPYSTKGPSSITYPPNDLCINWNVQLTLIWAPCACYNQWPLPMVFCPSVPHTWARKKRYALLLMVECLTFHLGFKLASHRTNTLTCHSNSLYSSLIPLSPPVLYQECMPTRKWATD